MTPPCPTRPCPTCGRVIPVNRWRASVLKTHGWRPHWREVILMPDGAEWFREIPVVGEAR